MSCCRSRPKQETTRISINQLLDEDFDSMRRMAQGICHTLGRPKDREICRSTLEELSKFNQAQSLLVKQNVNKFMVFYLKALRWTQMHQPLQLYKQWYGSGNITNRSFSTDANEEGASNDVRAWLEEGKSYIAMKSFEDGSTIVYAAVSKDPNAGWADNGLRLLKNRSNNCECPEDKLK